MGSKLKDRAEGIKNIDLNHEALPLEHALGVQWCIESDSFQFRITLKDRPFTRRRILSTVSSIYDLGFCSANPSGREKDSSGALQRKRRLGGRSS